MRKRSVHPLLNIPLREIMKDKKSLCRIYNYALNEKVRPSQLVFKYRDQRFAPNWPSYISIEYYRWHNFKPGTKYRTRVSIGYSEICGLQVDMSYTCISTPNNPEKIGAFIAKTGWVDERAINQKRQQIYRQRQDLQHQEMCINNRSFYR